VRATDPLTHSTTFMYDAVGNRLGITDPLTHTTTFGYDALNRVITATDPLTHSTLTAYDLAGNVISTTDALSHTTTALFGYNAANQLSAIADYSGSTVLAGYTYERDRLGQVISTTDGLQLLQHQYRYTPLNALSRDGAASSTFQGEGEGVS